ncbi:MAG TPA: GMP synthase (glutamine-hydrolyzing), partial [Acidocella sp.]|nr:GMP synthase (glutamine-hydrolyzing) [Acidocella sp.]
MHDEKILILDFGSQVTQLIARRLRESGVYCEIWPFNADPARIAAFGAKGFILSGGPASVADAGSPRAPEMVFAAGVPVLGICYGQMVMCAQLGGDVQGADIREFGRAYIDVVEDCTLFEGAWVKGAREQVWMSHGDHISA